MTSPTPDPDGRAEPTSPEPMTVEEAAKMLDELLELAARRWPAPLDARSADVAGPEYADRWSRFPVGRDAGSGVPLVWMRLDEPEWPAPFVGRRPPGRPGKSLSPLLREAMERVARGEQVHVGALAWAIDLNGGSMAASCMSDLAPTSPARPRSVLARARARAAAVWRTVVVWLRRFGKDV